MSKPGFKVQAYIFQSLALGALSCLPGGFCGTAVGLNWLSKSQRLHQAVSVEEKNPWNTRTLYADTDTLLLGSFQAPVLETELKSDLPVAFG